MAHFELTLLGSDMISAREHMLRLGVGARCYLSGDGFPRIIEERVGHTRKDWRYV